MKTCAKLPDLRTYTTVRLVGAAYRRLHYSVNNRTGAYLASEAGEIRATLLMKGESKQVDTMQRVGLPLACEDTAGAFRSLQREYLAAAGKAIKGLPRYVKPLTKEHVATIAAAPRALPSIVDAKVS